MKTGVGTLLEFARQKEGRGEGGFDSPNEREEKGGGSDLPNKMGGGFAKQNGWGGCFFL